MSAASKEICPICKSDAHSKYSDLYDDRYAYPGLFKLLKCRDCGHQFLHHNFSNSDLTNLYTNYYPRKTFSLADFRPLQEAKGFRSWLEGDYRAYSVVPRDVRILDIGCGFCESLAYHSNRGCTAYGVEADENAATVARIYGFNLHVGTFDGQNYETNFFDYVTMDQVVEHLVNPIKTLKEIYRILKPGGILALTTPNATGFGAHFFGKKWINWHVPYHLHHFSRKSLQHAARQSGFRITKIRTLTSSSWLYFQWMHSLDIPTPGCPSTFWSPHAQVDGGHKQIKRFYRLLHKLFIDRILTRIFDLLGIGDNWLVIMVKPI